MSFDIDALLPAESTDKDTIVTALTHHEIVVALSSALASRKVAVFHMLYPRTDARTHRSLDSLVDVLHNHGLHQTASLIAKEAHYLMFRDPAKAWRAFQEIRNDSLAIGVHLFYRGLEGDDAERALDTDAHAVKARARYAVA